MIFTQEMLIGVLAILAGSYMIWHSSLPRLAYYVFVLVSILVWWYWSMPDFFALAWCHDLGQTWVCDALWS